MQWGLIQLVNDLQLEELNNEKKKIEEQDGASGTFYANN